MANKLYQFLQGPDRGKVVELVGIEPEEGITFLKFDDGSRCNVEFAAPLNDARAFTDGKWVAEVCDRKNIWSFEDNSIKEEIRYGTLKDTGEVVAGWDPYIHGKNGNENKARQSVKAIPPRHVITKEEMRTGAEKLRELGITPDTPGYEEGLKNVTVPTQSSLLGNLVGKINIRNKEGGNYEDVMFGNVVDDQGNVIGKTTIGLDPTGAKPPSLKDMEHLIRATEVYIPENINESVSSDSAETEKPRDLSVSVSNNITKTVDTIIEKKNELAQKQKIEAENLDTHQLSQSVPQSDVDKSSPIYAIVSKCKKKDVTAPFELNLKLPGKSVYNLIQDDFGEEAIDEFFDIILSELDVEEIKRCLKESLKQSYTN